MTTTHSAVSVKDLEIDAANWDLDKAATIYREHGCLVVRGLMTEYVPSVKREIEQVMEETYALFDQAKKVVEGWVTPNGSLLLPAPKNFARDKQIMCLPIHYRNSSAFFHSALEPKTLDLAQAVLGPNIELFDEGQCLVKEPVGGHPKLLHQDASYFEHKYEGPLARLTYVVDTNVNNGALYVVPGSFKLGVLRHEDTFSHLGLSEKEWPWERALPVEGKAGDAILFHVNCIHGSKPNWSEKPRPVFIRRFRSADDYVVIGATTTANRAEAEKHKDEVKKTNQTNIIVRGFRKYDANR
jgi:ectoine hydroxylase-related dioxygenase (phytanoyl-CoA dioxygenase family)